MMAAMLQGSRILSQTTVTGSRCRQLAVHVSDVTARHTATIPQLVTQQCAFAVQTTTVDSCLAFTNCIHQLLKYHWVVIANSQQHVSDVTATSADIIPMRQHELHCE